VSVLGYLIQNYPDTSQARKAREQYKFLTGTDYPDVDPLKQSNGHGPDDKIEDKPTAQSSEKPNEKNGKLSTVSPVLETNNQQPDTEPELESFADAQLATPDEAATQKGDVADTASGYTTEDALQTNDRVGRALSNIFYALGWLLVPIGIFLILFSMAFKVLAIWSLVLLLLAPIFLGLGQTMWAIFDLRRINKRMLEIMEKRES
jgi:hypothetical protein